MKQENKNKNFIIKSTLTHGKDLFIYKNIEYVNTSTQVNLICKKHDFSFMVTPVAHFKGMGGCPLCYEEFQHLCHKNEKVGQKFTTNEGYTIEIVDYFTSTNCTVLLNDGTILENKAYNDIKRGQVKNPNKLIKLGVGYIGVGDYSSAKHLKAYKKWYNMLNRSYNDVDDFKSYKDVTVCEEWHNFQNFAKWFYENYNPETMQDWQLEKDILVKGNKIYSPETCCFVPQDINAMFIKSNNTRGKYPIGVHKGGNKFIAQLIIRGVVLAIGTYNTPEEAFQIYKKAKEQYIKEVADKWKDLIDPKVYKALYNYQVEITD